MKRLIAVVVALFVFSPAYAGEYFGSATYGLNYLSANPDINHDDREFGLSIGLLLTDHMTLGFHYQPEVLGTVDRVSSATNRTELTRLGISMNMFELGYFFVGAKKSSFYIKAALGVFDEYREEAVTNQMGTGFQSGGALEIAAGGSAGFQFKITEKREIFLGPDLGYYQAFGPYNESLTTARVLGTFWF